VEEAAEHTVAFLANRSNVLQHEIERNAEDEQRYAMYPEPPESAGGRLCNLILGMEQRAYLLGRSELTRGRAAAEREVAHVG
jgi:hypothetical protein